MASAFYGPPPYHGRSAELSLVEAMKPGQRCAFFKQPCEIAAVAGMVGTDGEGQEGNGSNWPNGSGSGGGSDAGGGGSANKTTASTAASKAAATPGAANVVQIIGITPRLAPGYGELLYAHPSPNLPGGAGDGNSGAAGGSGDAYSWRPASVRGGIRSASSQERDCSAAVE